MVLVGLSIPLAVISSFSPLALADDGFYVIPVKPAAVTHYYTLPGAVFVGDGNADRTPPPGSNPDGSIAWSSSGYFYAPVILPDGAKLTEFRVYCENAGTSSTYEVHLMRYDRPATSPVIMATVSIPNSSPYSSLVAPSISPDTIDNIDYSYAVVIKFTDYGQKVHAVRLIYTSS
jgi:hypothetical protein